MYFVAGTTKIDPLAAEKSGGPTDHVITDSPYSGARFTVFCFQNLPVISHNFCEVHLIHTFQLIVQNSPAPS